MFSYIVACLQYALKHWLRLCLNWKYRMTHFLYYFSCTMPVSCYSITLKRHCCWAHRIKGTLDNWGLIFYFPQKTWESFIPLKVYTYTCVETAIQFQREMNLSVAIFSQHLEMASYFSNVEENSGACCRSSDKYKI